MAKITLEEIRKVDPTGMVDLIWNLPEQCQEGLRIGREADLSALDFLQEENGFSSVLVLGMGGSAIGGDLVRALGAAEMSIPMQVNREYQIPGYVGPDTLVIASSYSGNTEETLTALEEVWERNARVVCITTGGKLAKWARENGVPLVTIPGGISPRAAVGYSFVPLLVILERLGLVAPIGDSFQEMIQVMVQIRQEMGPESHEGNQAKELAQTLQGKMPLFYGSEGWPAVVAVRIKGQINENSKNIAFSNAFPELNHNETVGWEAPDLTHQVHLVLLRHGGESPRMAKRIEVTSEIMRPRIDGVSQIWARGESSLARLFSLLYIGDWVSVYLATLNGIDPTPVRVIDQLKGELAKMD